MSFAVNCFNSPVGILSVFEIDGGVCALEWGRPPENIPSPFLDDVIGQLKEYFDGNRTEFDVTFKPAGTAFQQRVWKRLQQIPFGETLTYGELAKQMHSSPRAIGMACGSNPIPILIPCHRVVASGGKLKGYSGEGGIDTKAFLLSLEGLHFDPQKILL